MEIDIYQAILEDDADKLGSVLNEGGDPNGWLEDVVRRSGKSMLHVCCEKGRYTCVKVNNFSLFLFLKQKSVCKDVHTTVNFEYNTQVKKC